MKRRSPSTPNPLFTRPQHAVSVPVGGSSRLYPPDLAARARSIAHAVFSGPVTHSTLSRSSGVVSNRLPEMSVWNVHCGTRRVTFSGVIW